jgi:hypothetical protein
MVDRHLVNYIRDNLAQGHDLEEIRRHLATYGWAEKDINAGILEASGAGTQDTKTALGPDKKKKGHKKIIIGLIVVIILIFLFLYVATDIVRTFREMFPVNMIPFFNSTLVG